MGFITDLLNINGTTRDKEKKDLAVLYHWLQEQGGVHALIENMQEGKCSNILASWVGNKDNVSVTIDFIRSCFSEASIDELASKLGMDSDQVYVLMMTWLPKIIGNEGTLDVKSIR